MKPLMITTMAVLLLLAGCGERGPENKPETQVNFPRPTEIATNAPPK